MASIVTQGIGPEATIEKFLLLGLESGVSVIGGGGSGFSGSGRYRPTVWDFLRVDQVIDLPPARSVASISISRGSGELVYWMRAISIAAPSIGTGTLEYVDTLLPEARSIAAASESKGSGEVYFTLPDQLEDVALLADRLARKGDTRLQRLVQRTKEQRMEERIRALEERLEQLSR